MFSTFIKMRQWGAIVGVYSGSFLYGALTAALFHVWALIAADLGAKNKKFFNLPKVLRSLTRLPIPATFRLSIQLLDL